MVARDSPVMVEPFNSSRRISRRNLILEEAIKGKQWNSTLFAFSLIIEGTTEKVWNL
jgi:hypothetical protein